MKSFKQFLIEDSGETPKPKKLSYHEGFHNKLKKSFGKEYDIILKAAQRNGIIDTDYDNLSFLFSIRKQENGGMGKEFGVLTPRAGAKPGDTAEQTLDRQAGAAAYEVMRRRNEYAKLKNPTSDFTTYFGNIWAPIGVKNDPTNLNKNWIPGVSKFKNEFDTCVGEDCEPRPNTQQTIKPTEQKPIEQKPAEQKPAEQQTQPDLNSPAIPPLGGTKKR